MNISPAELSAALSNPDIAIDGEYTAVSSPKRHKYNAVATEVDGRWFASKAEAARFVDLSYMEQAGLISNLKCQPRYPLVVNGVRIGTYVGDFVYVEDGKIIVEDVKGMSTSIYRLKKKLVKALYGIEIKEVKA